MTITFCQRARAVQIDLDEQRAGARFPVAGPPTIACGWGPFCPDVAAESRAVRRTVTVVFGPFHWGGHHWTQAPKGPGPRIQGPWPSGGNPYLPAHLTE